MKRRVVCVFSLIFWLIILCTLLSIRVEQLMKTTVEIREINMPMPNTSISADALFYDEAGMHLYKVSPSYGWDAGMRVSEYSGYVLQNDRLSNLDNGWFVLYATHDLRPNDEVLIREEPYLYMDDIWVATYPNGIPAYSLAADNITAEVQTDTALLLSVPGADYPFMEGRARTWIETVKSEDYYMQAPESAVYSLNDLYRFINSALPMALLVSLILFSIAIWARCCSLSRSCKENGRALLINSALAAMTLLGIILTLQFIDLPGSLLPSDRITHITCYVAKLSALFSALRDLAQNGSAAADSALRFAESRLILSGLAVLTGAVLSAGKLVFGRKLDRAHSKPKPKHAAW